MPVDNDIKNATSWNKKYHLFKSDLCKCPQCHRSVDRLLRRTLTRDGRTLELHRCTCGIRWWMDLTELDDEGYYLASAAGVNYKHR